MYTRCIDLHQKPENFIGKKITIGGWIRTLRDSKTITFIELYDGSFFKTVQLVSDTNQLDSRLNGVTIYGNIRDNKGKPARILVNVY